MTGEKRGPNVDVQRRVSQKKKQMKTSKLATSTSSEVPLRDASDIVDLAVGVGECQRWLWWLL